MEVAAELIERARLVCGNEHVLTDPAALSTYRSDGVKRSGPLPFAVVLPAHGAEVSGVVGACAELGVPWVARGAGTSTDGGALPTAVSLVIALTRMRRILSLDLDDDEVTVEPGAPTAAVSRALAPTHTIPWDTVSTAGGAAAQGTLADQLIGLDLVDRGGRLVRLDALVPGYDIAGVFSGSQGARGIAVALTLRAVPTQ